MKHVFISLKTSKAMRTNFLASLAIAAIALAIMTTIAGCSNDNTLASENAQLRQEVEAAAAYINLLESDIERMDVAYERHPHYDLCERSVDIFTMCGGGGGGVIERQNYATSAQKKGDK